MEPKRVIYTTATIGNSFYYYSSKHSSLRRAKTAVSVSLEMKATHKPKTEQTHTYTYGDSRVYIQTVLKTNTYTYRTN